MGVYLDAISRRQLSRAHLDPGDERLPNDIAAVIEGLGTVGRVYILERVEGTWQVREEMDDGA